MVLAKEQIQKFVLLNRVTVQSNGSIAIKVESQLCMKYILLTSTVPQIQFIHPSKRSYKFSQQSNNAQSQLSCIYTIAGNTTAEFELNFKIVEGNRGEISVYVISHEQEELCQSFKIFIKPLFLHQPSSEKMISYDTEWSNELLIIGQMKASDIKFWLQELVDYQQPIEDVDGLNLWFDNSFLSSFLHVHYAHDKQCLSFHSDSIQTISIIREFIMEECNARGLQVNIKHAIHPKSIKKSLKILRDKLREQKKVIESQKILIALKDILNQEKDASFLSHRDQQILNNEQQINSAVETSEKEMHYLKSIILQIYISKAKINGQYNYQANIEKLGQLLDSYKYKQIYEMLAAE